MSPLLPNHHGYARMPAFIYKYDSIQAMKSFSKQLKSISVFLKPISYYIITDIDVNLKMESLREFVNFTTWQQRR